MFRITVVYTPEQAKNEFSRVDIFHGSMEQCLQKASGYNQALVTSIHIEFIKLGGVSKINSN